jgi:hypothetical protein
LATRSKTRSNNSAETNGGTREIEWLVGNLNQILADLAMHPPDMQQAWRFSHEDPRGKILVEFQPSKP